MVFLTKSGKALEDRLLPLAHDLVTEAVVDLSADELDMLQEVLQKIHGRLVSTRDLAKTT